jgi:hypothetical protein
VKTLRKRSMLLFIMAMAFGMMAVPHSAFASNWYVRSTAACSTNGDGSASTCEGSSGTAGAFSGFGNVNWSRMSNNDTLFLVAGDTYSGSGVSIGHSNITVSVTGSGSAVLALTGSGDGFDYGANSNVTVNGLTGNAAFGGSTSYGIVVTNIGDGGRCAYSNNGGSNNKLLHVECQVASTTQPDDNFGGVYFSGGNGFEVAYNWIHPPTSTKTRATGITMWSNGGLSSFTANLEHDNRVDNLSDDGIRCGADCSNYHNEVSHIDGSGHSDSLLAQSGSYIAIYNNFVHDSGDQNIYLDNLYNSACSHIRIYNNVIASNPGFGVVIDPEGGVGGTCPDGPGGSIAAWDDVVIANNTFYTTSASAIRGGSRGTGSQTTNLVIVNNIFGNVTDGGYRSVDLDSNVSFAAMGWNYDTYANTSANYPTIASWQSNMTLTQIKALSPARELNGEVGIPAYVNPSGSDFHLALSDAIAIAKGQNLALSYGFLATDKDGNPRPSSGSWDLGAYQSQSTANRPTPPTNVQAVAQ